ncbi:MAG: flagellar motor protein MotB [Acidobacteriota bacterium]
MSDSNTPPTIIIIKKKVNHGGHHGGAWKVAYADFVTAMMALFIVLWLLSSSEKVKEAVSSYFKDPTGSGKEKGSSATGTGESISIKKDDMGQLKEKLEAALKQTPELEKLKEYVQMTVTGEGLRIELLESEKGMFFQSGSSTPSPLGKELIAKLAQELGQLPNELLIEGHTDSRPFGAKTDYSNWELSSDRANAARRLMETGGLRSGQVVQVRGFADHSLRQPEDPEAASNRRISVIVRYMPAPPKSEGKEGQGKAGDGGHEGGKEDGAEKKAGEAPKEGAKESEHK